MHAINRIHRVITALAVVVLAPTLACAQTADLRWRPTKGQSFIYELTQKSTNRTVSDAADTKPAPATNPKRQRGPSKTPPSAPPPGSNTPASPLDSTIDQSLTLRLNVKATDKERNSTVELTIDRVRATIKAAGSTTDFDSEKPAPSTGDEPVAAALRAVAGTTLTLTVDSNGRITKSEGGGETLGLSSLLGGAGMNGPALPKDALGLISSADTSPSSAKIGQHWTTTSTLDASLLGNIAITTRHTLDHIRAGNAEVSMTGSLEPFKSDPNQHAESPFKVSSASNKGAYVWDTESGWLESLTLTQSVRIEADILGEKRSMDSATETTVKRTR